METNIRPLSLGEILDRTAQLYRSNFLLFAGIFSVYSGILLMMNLASIAITSMLKFEAEPVAVKAMLIAALIVKWFLVIAAAAVTTAAINRAVAWVHLGQPASIASAFGSVLKRLGSYLWLTAIVDSIVLGPLVLILIGLFAVLFSVPGLLDGKLDTSNTGSVALLAVGAIALGLLSLGWLVYAALMSLRYVLSIPVCVMEDLPARPAIRRSIVLTKGARGRIFVLLLLVAAIQIGFGAVSQIFIFVLAVKNHGQLSPLAQTISQIIAFFTNTFVGPIGATGITLFYYDQRVRKEGFDIEWMMQSAGMSAQQAPEAPVHAAPEMNIALPAHGADGLHE